MKVSKKSILAAILAFILAFAPITAFADTDDGFLPTRLIEGQYFVPARQFANMHGITVEWHEETNEIVFIFENDFRSHHWHTSPDGLVGFVDDGTTWAPIVELTSIFGQMISPFDSFTMWEDIPAVDASRTDLWQEENFTDIHDAMFSTELPHGEIGLGFIKYLNDNLYSRSPFTYREKEAARWIVEELLAMGHSFESIEVQEFAFIETLDITEFMTPSLGWIGSPTMLGDGVLRENQLSQNVILTIPGDGDGIIIVGAHYDTLPYPGASDNASGTALLMESAQRMLELENEHTIIYVWFGAEEVGLLGAYFFYNSLTDEQRDDIVMMINADVLFEGSYFIYGTGVHAEPDEDELLEAVASLLDQFGMTAEDMRMTEEEFEMFIEENLENFARFATQAGFIDIGTSETSLIVDSIAEEVMEQFEITLIAEPSYIYMSSDQLAFVFSGYTIVTFAGMDWEEDEDHPHGGMYTVRVLHTPQDDFHFIEERWPGKMLDAMRTFGLFLEAILTTSFN